MMPNGHFSVFTVLNASVVFDQADHTLLLERLSSHGSRDTMFPWCFSYLTGQSSLVSSSGWPSFSWALNGRNPELSLWPSSFTHSLVILTSTMISNMLMIPKWISIKLQSLPWESNFQTIIISTKRLTDISFLTCPKTSSHTHNHHDHHHHTKNCSSIIKPLHLRKSHLSWIVLLHISHPTYQEASSSQPLKHILKTSPVTTPVQATIISCNNIITNLPFS